MKHLSNYVDVSVFSKFYPFGIVSIGDRGIQDGVRLGLCFLRSCSLDIKLFEIVYRSIGNNPHCYVVYV